MPDDVAPLQATISCVVCQQRKVKCDKVRPTCSNCARYHAACVYVGRSKRLPKKRGPQNEISGRSNKHASPLESSSTPSVGRTRILTPARNGASIKGSDVISSVVRSNPFLGRQCNNPKSPGKLIIHDGTQSFIESGLWNNLSEELQGPHDMQRLLQFSGRDRHHLSLDPSFKGLLNAGELLLNTAITSSPAELKALHPEPILFFRLWQVFLDNVNPLTKLIHAPTTQQIILNAISHPENIASDLEAFLFAIYLSAIHSMSADDCQSIMGESKRVLFCRYNDAVKEALLRAKFVSSINIVLIQAFTLYLFSVRQFHEPNSLWILTGTVMRMAQRLGLHRDGSLIGLPPFEIEIRRRIWWSLLYLDGQTSEFCGAGVSTCPRFDTKPPLNVNDSDLSPSMSLLPAEHEGSTEMMLCCFRCEIEHIFKDWKEIGRWGLGFNGTHNALQEERLNEFQAFIKRKYLRFCDPSVPIQLFTQIVSETTIASLRLMARHPRNYPQGGIEMSLKERKEVFKISLQVLELYNLTLRTESIHQFLWDINLQFQWHAFVFLAYELQFRPEDKETDDAWSKIEELFEYNPDVITNTNTPLHDAVSRLILQAWSIRQARSQRYNSQRATPGFISTLETQGIQNDAVNYAKTSKEPAQAVYPEFEPDSENVLIDSASPINDFQESFTPDTLENRNLIDWTGWDYMLQDFEFQNASFTQSGS